MSGGVCGVFAVGWGWWFMVWVRGGIPAQGWFLVCVSWLWDYGVVGCGWLL